MSGLGATDVASTAPEDFSDLDSMGFLMTGGVTDKQGRPVLVVVAKAFVWRSCPDAQRLAR